MPRDSRKPVALRSVAVGQMADSSTEGARTSLDVRGPLILGALGLAAAVAFGLADFSTPAKAVPSFARQTGQPCATCHTNFPELTPYGRRFKLMGYTITGGTEPWEVPPIAAMVLSPLTFQGW